MPKVPGAIVLLVQAVLAAQPTSGPPPLSVAFDTAGSATDGAPLEHFLFPGDGAALPLGAASVKQTYAYQLAGSYLAETWLRDGSGIALSPPVGISIARVSDGRDPPSVRLSVDKSGGATFTFSAVVTPAPGDSIVARRWDFGDGTFGSGDKPATHTYATPGVFQARFCATTRAGLPAWAPVIVRAGTAPSLLGAASPQAGLPHAPVTLTAWVEGGEVASAEVAWPELLDPAPAVTPTPSGPIVTSTHSFDQGGYFDVPVRVFLVGQMTPLVATAHVAVRLPDGTPPSPILVMTPSATATAGVPYEPNGDGAATRGLAVVGKGPFAYGAAAPSPANFSVDDAGNVAWTPTNAQAGRQRLAVRVVDGDGREMTREWLVDVQAMSDGGCTLVRFASGNENANGIVIAIAIAMVFYGCTLRQASKQGTKSSAPPASIRGSEIAPPV
jgi:hypothetical protein